VELEHQQAFNTQLEMDLIGHMILKPADILEVADILRPEHFYHSIYRLTYERMLELWREDETSITLPNIVNNLTDRDVLASKLTDAAASVILIGPIRIHAKQLIELWSLREIVKIGHEITQINHLRGDEIKSAINTMETKIANVLDTESGESMKTLEESLYDFGLEFEEAYQRGEGITGVSSGFADLDMKTAGFQKSELIILAGRPSMGKTAFALEVAKNISTYETVLFFSLEMSNKSLTKRLVAAQASIISQQMSSGVVTEEEYNRYVEAMGMLGRHKLIIDDQANFSVQDMRAKARRVKRERGLSCIIIDYLQLIKGSGKEQRYLEVGEITRQLKMLAKEFDIPVIVLAQLSRSVEQRQDKRPMLSDLRESGSIEQDADLVIFIYRDEYYNQDTEARNIAELIIAKQRNGPTGTIQTLYLKEYNRFLDLEIKR
jgi:replicative DNA helicase